MHVSPSLGCKADGRRRFAASSPSSAIHHTTCCSLFAALDVCWIASREEATGLLVSLCPDPATRTPLRLFSLVSFAIPPPPPTFLVDTFWDVFFSLGVWDMELVWDGGLLGF